MKFFICKKGCCKLKTTPYIYHKKYIISKKRCKAGVFIYDPHKNKVLVVQSRGNMWGLPKGTLEYSETEIQCAVREVKEETGLDITEDDFTQSVKIKNIAMYFYMQKDECDVDVQDQIVDNDANSVGWIKPECMNDCISSSIMIPNKHCRIVFQKFIGIELS